MSFLDTRHDLPPTAWPKPQVYTVRVAHLSQPATIEVLYLPGSMAWRYLVTYASEEIGYGLVSSQDQAKRDAEQIVKAHGVVITDRVEVSS